MSQLSTDVKTDEEFVLYKTESDDESVQLGDITEELNFWHSCRICGGLKDDMVSIYDQAGTDLQLEEKINNYLPIMVSADDDLPLFVCCACVDKLNTTHELVVLCIEANNKFKDYLKSREEKMQKEDNEIAEMVVLKLVENANKDHIATEKCERSIKESCEETDYVQSHENSVCSSFDFSGTHVPKSVSDRDSLNSVTNTEPFMSVPVRNEFPATEHYNTKNCCSDTREKVISVQLHEDGFMHCSESDLATYSSFTKTKTLQIETNGSTFELPEFVDSTNFNRQAVMLACSKCGFTSHSENDLNTHITHICFDREEQLLGNQQHEYTDCRKTFAHGDSLQIHQIGHAVSASFISEQPWSCPDCEMSFRSRELLQAHKESCHGPPGLCDFCGQTFCRTEELRQHRRIAHIHRLRCQFCHRLFRNRFLLREHLAEHEKSAVQPTELQFISGIDLTHNLEDGDIVIPLTPHECGICGAGFARKGSLTKHYKTHAGDGTVACRTCHATFPSVAGLLNHRKTHVPPGTPCEWDISPAPTVLASGPSPIPSTPAVVPLLTSASTPSPVSNNHTTNPAESFRCPRCDKLLSSKLSLALHTRVHTGEKPFECGVCHKRFTQKPALTYHMRLHTGERPHTCRFCGKGFNSKVGKESHERIHTGERPYRCGQCGVGFRCSANLRQHTWIHTDSRPFTCEVCHKPFRRREALQVHMRTHTGERPYQCPRCGRRFTQKGDMLKHTRSHDRPGGGRAPPAPAATCHTCGQAFAQRKHLKAHRCLLANKSNSQIGNVVTDIITFPEITVVSSDIHGFDVDFVS